MTDKNTLHFITIYHITLSETISIEKHVNFWKVFRYTDINDNRKGQTKGDEQYYSLTFAAFLVVHQLEAVVAAAVEATDKVRADVNATVILL